MHMIAHKLEARDNASDLWRTLPAALVGITFKSSHTDNLTSVVTVFQGGNLALWYGRGSRLK